MIDWERYIDRTMQGPDAWQFFKPMLPRRLVNGSFSGWFESETIMRRRVNGAWVYRRMNDLEATVDRAQRVDFQAW